MDTTIDFVGFVAQFDAFLMGWNTHGVLVSQGPSNPTQGKHVIVVSRTLYQRTNARVAVISDRIAEEVAALKVKSGKDI